VEFGINQCRSLEHANLFLAASFIKKHNDRFAVDPASSGSAFSPAPDPNTLELILAWRHERKASSGSVISFEGQRFQLASASGNIVPLRPKNPITVVRTLSGALKAIHNNKAFDLVPAPERTAQTPASKTRETIDPVPVKPPIPASNHPWRQYPNSIRIQETENSKILDKIEVVSCK